MKSAVHEVVKPWSRPGSGEAVWQSVKTKCFDTNASSTITRLIALAAIPPAMPNDELWCPSNSLWDQLKTRGASVWAAWELQSTPRGAGWSQSVRKWPFNALPRLRQTQGRVRGVQEPFPSGTFINYPLYFYTPMPPIPVTQASSGHSLINPCLPETRLAIMEIFCFNRP